MEITQETKEIIIDFPKLSHHRLDERVDTGYAALAYAALTTLVKMQSEAHTKPLWYDEAVEELRFLDGLLLNRYVQARNELAKIPQRIIDKSHS